MTWRPTFGKDGEYEQWFKDFGHTEAQVHSAFGGWSATFGVGNAELTTEPRSTPEAAMALADRVVPRFR